VAAEAADWADRAPDADKARRAGQLSPVGLAALKARLADLRKPVDAPDRAQPAEPL
jgi:hypothetical protein